jgi:chemotaxis protein CheD
MAQRTVDISDLVTTDDPEDVLVTYALGSCIAVLLYDRVRRAAGMIHYMLPLSSTNVERARAKPAMFADTGVPLLFERMYRLGCEKKNLVVKAAGGGQLYDDHGTFEIGRRNYTILRKMLWRNNVLITAEDVGGTKSRTVRMWTATGRVVVHASGEETEL